MTINGTSQEDAFFDSEPSTAGTPSPTPTASPTATATSTSTPTPTPTATPRATPTPRITPTPRSRPTPPPRGGNGLDVGGDHNGAGGTGLLTVTNAAKVTTVSAHLWASGTVTGNATVSTTNGTVVDGTVAPNGGGTTLTFDGDGALQLNSGATTQCNVTPQDPSTTPQVSVTGQVSLGGRLSVTMTGDFSSAPTRFTLLNAGSVNSSHRKFDSTSITYPTNQCWTPQIDYVTDNNGQYHVYLDRLVCTN